MSIYRNRDQGSRGGAEHLARIHGTEEDKVNCPFYFKIGACRHGDKCSRQHHRPPFSETVIVKQMWNNPMIAVASTGGNLNLVDRSKLQENLDEFYDEIFEEFQKFGKLEDVQVCENLGRLILLKSIILFQIILILLYTFVNERRSHGGECLYKILRRRRC